MKIASFLVLASCWIFSNATAQVSVSTQDVGEIYQSNYAKSAITLANGSDKSIKLSAVTAVSDLDKVGEFPSTLAPKSTANIPIELFSGMDSGDRRHIFYIKSDIENHPSLQVQVHLFGLSILDEPVPQVDLGPVQKGENAVRSVTLSSREVDGFRVERIIDQPNFATAKIADDGRTVEITGKPSTELGQRIGYVKLKVNSTIQPEVWIAVTADVRGDVIASQNPIDLGIIKNGAIVPTVVQLTSRDGGPVRVGAITMERLKGRAVVEPCVGSKKGCSQIKLTLDSDQPGGKITGRLLVDLPDQHMQLPLEVTGLYFSKNVQIRSLDNILPKANENGGQSNTGIANLDDALYNAVQSKPSVPDPAGSGPLIRWQASNEYSVHGYIVYRSDTDSGQYLRVNKDTIGAAGEGRSVSSYAWRDGSAIPGHTYWYYVGLIYKDGTKQQLSGPQKVVAK